RAAGAADAFVSRLDATPLQQAENFRRKYETAAHTRRLEDIRSGDYSRIRGAVEETADSAGVPFLDRTAGAMSRRFSDWSGGSPEEGGLAQISGIEYNLKNQVGGDKAAADAQLKALQELKTELQGIRANQQKRSVNINAHTEPTER
ncbi:MAG: hypothetical protein IAF94_09425, partial [Pirellulaceae bacterium]|nr:hypothetical protein [Pirellulaceae bacterium]